VDPDVLVLFIDCSHVRTALDDIRRSTTILSSAASASATISSWRGSCKVLILGEGRVCIFPALREEFAVRVDDFKEFFGGPKVEF
jgi:hypothetical protein